MLDGVMCVGGVWGGGCGVGGGGGGGVGGGFVVKAWRGVLLVQLGCREAIVVKINTVEGKYSVCVCLCVERIKTSTQLCRDHGLYRVFGTTRVPTTKSNPLTIDLG